MCSAAGPKVRLFSSLLTLMVGSVYAVLPSCRLAKGNSEAYCHSCSFCLHTVITFHKSNHYDRCFFSAGFLTRSLLTCSSKTAMPVQWIKSVDLLMITHAAKQRRTVLPSKAGFRIFSCSFVVSGKTTLSSSFAVLVFFCQFCAQSLHLLARSSSFAALFDTAALQLPVSLFLCSSTIVS